MARLPAGFRCRAGSPGNGHGKACQHAGGRRNRYGEEEADKAEQIAESQQREDEPHRMQAGAFDRRALATAHCLRETDRTGRRRRRRAIRFQSGKKLRQRHAEGNHKSRQRTDVRNEGQQAGHRADQQPKAQSGQRQAECIIAAEDDTHDELTVQIAGDRRCRSGAPSPRTVSRCLTGIRPSNEFTTRFQSLSR